MMYQINESCIYVKGAKNGAIYQFDTGMVYSINQSACYILDRYIENNIQNGDSTYLDKLRDKALITDNYLPTVYIPKKNTDIELEVAWIEITQACNLRCVHCYEGTVHRKLDNALQIEEWKNIIDQLDALHLKRLIIIGGEPCCNENVIEIISYASQKKMDVTLFTNGTLFDEKLISTVIKSNIRVKLSVYGHVAAIHDGITRKPGSYLKLVDTVSKLVEFGVPTSAAVIIMRENENYVKEILDFCRNLGMKCSKYDVIREVFGGVQNKHIPSNKNVLREVYFTKPNFRADKRRFDANYYENSCWYGKVAIMENGDVIPCEFERNIKYGNIRVNTLQEILKGEIARKYFFWSFDQVKGCCDCEYRFACKDCRPIAESVCGKLDTKNPRCLYDVYNGEWREL